MKKLIGKIKEIIGWIVLTPCTLVLFVVGFATLLLTFLFMGLSFLIVGLVSLFT